MAFQPLRRRVVHLADRLAFGASATPYEALADLARRLGESPDPTHLLPAVAEAAGTAVSARRTTVRLRVPGAADQVGRWPAAGEAGDAGPASRRDPGRRPRRDTGHAARRDATGRDLRQHDSRLLQDLATSRPSASATPGSPPNWPTRSPTRPAHRGAGRVAPAADHGGRRRAPAAGAGDRPRGRAAPGPAAGPLQELAGSAGTTALDPGAVGRWSRRRLRRWRRCARSPGASSPPCWPAPGWRRRCSPCRPGRRTAGEPTGPRATGWTSGSRPRRTSASPRCCASLPPVEVVLGHRDGGCSRSGRRTPAAAARRLRSATGSRPSAAPWTHRRGTNALEVRLPASRAEVPAMTRARARLLRRLAGCAGGPAARRAGQPWFFLGWSACPRGREQLAGPHPRPDPVGRAGRRHRLAPRHRVGWLFVVRALLA